MIYIDEEKCTGCGVCEEVCPVEAVQVSDGVGRIDQDRCNECQACVEACPNGAILMVIEPAEEKATSLTTVAAQPMSRPAPEVALAEPHRSKVMPIVGAALAFLGREVVPRLAPYLLDALDRRLSQQPAAVSSTNNLAPSSGGKGGQRGRRHQHRRQGK